MELLVKLIDEDLKDIAGCWSALYVGAIYDEDVRERASRTGASCCC